MFRGSALRAFSSVAAFSVERPDETIDDASISDTHMLITVGGL